MIADALNGVGLLLDIEEPLSKSLWLAAPAPGCASRLYAEVCDSIRLDGTDAKHGADGQALLKKLQALPHREQVRLVLNIAAAWDHYDSPEVWEACLGACALAEVKTSQKQSCAAL